MAEKDTGKVNIHGKQYETVASRVQRFRQEYGDEYGITTEIVSADSERVVMKACIRSMKDNAGYIATGFAEEVRSSSSINRTSALENAETSAIGRALANFGMAGTEYASADEVANAIGQRQAPAMPGAPKPEKAKLGLATPQQKARLTFLLKRAGVEPEDMKGVLMGEYGLSADSEKWTKGDAARVIEELEEFYA